MYSGGPGTGARLSLQILAALGRLGAGAGAHQASGKCCLVLSVLGQRGVTRGAPAAEPISACHSE